MASFLRFSTLRLPVIMLAVTGLNACALQPRAGPPAPVVQISPQQKTPRQRQHVSPLPPRNADGAAPASERMSPLPKPVAPAKPKTKVYVYRDPSVAPDAEPAAPAEPTASDSAPPPDSTPAAAPAPDRVTAPPVAVAMTPTRTPSVVIAKHSPTTLPTTASAAVTLPSAVKAASPAPASAPLVVAKVEPPHSVPPAPPKSEPPPVVRIAPPPPPPPPPAPPITAPPLPPAAQALASQAEQQRKAGDYTGAAALLERSLRIAPREPYLWNRLARVRMEQGQIHQAGNLASRANDLSGQNAAVKQDNWRIIAHSKRQAGDAAAADAAQQRADAE